MTPRNRFTRQIHRLLSIVLLCVLAINERSSHAQDSIPSAQSSASKLGVSKPMPPYIVGADISWVQAEEDGGEVFTEGGVTKDIFRS